MKYSVLTMIVFCLILLLISFILMKIEHIFIVRKMHKAINDAVITKEFANISKQYCVIKEKGFFDNVPNIQAFIEQSNFIITACPFDMSKLEFGNVNKKNYEPLIDRNIIENIPDELEKAKDETKELLKRFFSVSEELYKSKYPIKYVFKKIRRELHM